MAKSGLLAAPCPYTSAGGGEGGQGASSARSRGIWGWPTRRFVLLAAATAPPPPAGAASPPLGAKQNAAASPPPASSETPREATPHGPRAVRARGRGSGVTSRPRCASLVKKRERKTNAPGGGGGRARTSCTGQALPSHGWSPPLSSAQPLRPHGSTPFFSPFFF